MNEIVKGMIQNLADTTPEPEDYKGEDGLLYCGKCNKPKEAYFPKGRELFLTVTLPNVTAGRRNGSRGKGRKHSRGTAWRWSV